MTSDRVYWAAARSQPFTFLLLLPRGETVALHGWSEDGRKVISALMLGYVWGHN